MSEVTPPLAHNHCVILQQPQRKREGKGGGRKRRRETGEREKETDRHRPVDERGNVFSLQNRVLYASLAGN